MLAARAELLTYRHSQKALTLAIILALGAAAAGCAGSHAPSELRITTHQLALEKLAAETQGVLGACIADDQGVACVNGDRPMPMQSVMKLLVGLAVFDAADRGALGLDEEVFVRREDLSVYVQPIAQLVGSKGYRTTIRDLVWRAVVQSDSAATDILVTRLGGPAKIQAVLNARKISGVRFDRDEKRLQSDIAGLEWRPEYVDAALYERAIAALPADRRGVAYHAYRADVRDTATAKGMAALLRRLAIGELLSPRSTQVLLQIMKETQTFPDRLPAGTPEGWTIAHKTGTSGSWEGITAATNDVGIMTSPAGVNVGVAAFIADSPATQEVRARVIAQVAQIAATEDRVSEDH